MNKNGDLRRAVTRQLLSSREKAKERENLKLPDLEKRARQVVETKFWVSCEIVMTVYALTADDVRLMCTNAPADPIFDIFTAISFSFFLADILLLSLARDDYFMGNMFLLDSISTLTLIFDFSFVDISVDKRSLDNFRSARTARLGVRASRIAWTIRQTRMYKTCKPFFFPSEKEPQKPIALNAVRSTTRTTLATAPGEVLETPAVGSASDDKLEGLMIESMVGRKLASLTVCRVIAVVLLMVVILPLMQIDASLQLPTSVDYGSELVHEALMKLQRNSSEYNKARYERTLLQFIYYHNWFMQRGGCPDQSRVCAADYYNSIFGFGLAGWGSPEGLSLAAMSEAVRIRRASLEEFQSSRKLITMFDYGSMPEPAQTFLTSPWSSKCKDWHLGLSLIAEEIDDVVSYPVECPEDFRSIETTRFTPRVLTNDELSRWHIAFFTDDRPYIREMAGRNLISTAAICLLLCIAAMFIFHDARVLILRPLESMMLKVQLIKLNPLMAKEIANDALKAEWIDQDAPETPARTSLKKVLGMSILARIKRVARKHAPLTQEHKVEYQPMETRILENTIVKLGMLLMLGFGEAGVNILSRNMTCEDQEWIDGKVEARAWVNGMVPGVITECLVGVTRIENFAVMTEVLQCHVMAFVNQIAEIVHGVVDAFHGAPNSVNGDEFLLIWLTSNMDQEQKSKMADMAICAFVRINAAVHSSRTLAQYRKHPGLQERLGTHCRINVTSGLHHGWAIEGAIGTEFKIDASYVSEHVSVAGSIQRAATDVYGVNFLMTGTVLKLASEEMAILCRLIDRATLHTPEVRELYTFDMHWSLVGLEPALNHKLTRAPFTAKQRFKYRQQLELQKTKKWGSRLNMTRFLTKGWGMEVMRTPYTVEFVQIFNMGLQQYFLGEWRAARQLLRHCRWLLGFEDGPSAALVDFMDSCNGTPPKNWQGVHALDGMQKRGRTNPAVNGLADDGRLDMMDHLEEVIKPKSETSPKKVKLMKKSALAGSNENLRTLSVPLVTTPAAILREGENENQPLIKPQVSDASSHTEPTTPSSRPHLHSFASGIFEPSEAPGGREAGKLKIKRRVKSMIRPKTGESSPDVASVIGRQSEFVDDRDTVSDLSFLEDDLDLSLGSKANQDGSGSKDMKIFAEASGSKDMKSFAEASTSESFGSQIHRKRKIKCKRSLPSPEKRQQQSSFTILEDDVRPSLRPSTGSIFSGEKQEETLALTSNQF